MRLVYFRAKPRSQPAALHLANADGKPACGTWPSVPPARVILTNGPGPTCKRCLRLQQRAAEAESRQALTAIGRTTRQGTLPGGGRYFIHMSSSALAVNGQPVLPGQVITEYVVGAVEDAITRVQRRRPKIPAI